MRAIYEITEKVRDSVQSNGITNKVTFGDILEVDLDKTTMYPLAHLVLGTATFQDVMVIVPIEVLFIDILDVTKKFTDEDVFYGNNNLQDVLNTQFQAANLLQSNLRRGTIYRDLFQVVGDVTAEPFLDNFENQLAGWSVSFNVEFPNNEISIC